ncbi:MAG: exodeoxyribonuclease V subunit beta [Planctomycetes bacterium]|nr:exodeoxyribonuclease V subunit beta [Planctomycetota bacterium]
MTGYRKFALGTDPLGQGTVLLEASAGTGKTYTLVGILLRLLLEEEIPSIDQALVVTFTVAATEELKTRLRKGLVTALAACEGRPAADEFFQGLARHGDKGARILRRALAEFDQVAIATIHGFCKRVLDETAFESREPFDLDFALDEVPLWELAAEDALRSVRALPFASLGAVLDHRDLAPGKLVAHYRLWQRHPDVALQPEAPDPEACLRALQDAVAPAAALFDDTIRAQLANLRWRAKKSPITPDPEGSLERLRETLAHDPGLAIVPLLDFSAPALEETKSKRPPQPLSHPFLDACTAVAAAFDTALAHVRSLLLRSMHERIEAHKREQRVLSFSDLLQRTLAALRDPARAKIVLPALRSRHVAALIDEFQDTDSVQYEIFSTCFANRPLFLVGDPKQSIYGFRGADLETYFAARNDAVARATLADNHRSSRELVHATNLLFASAHAFVDERLLFAPAQAAARAGALGIAGDPGAPFRWRFLPPTVTGKPAMIPTDVAEERIAKDVAAEISRVLRCGATIDGRSVRPRDVAVLTRTNRQAVLVQDTLRDTGIVAAIGKAGDIFETDEFDDVERLLTAVLLPVDLARARAAMATRLWGFDARRLAAMDPDGAAFETELARLERWRQTWIRRGFVVAKEQMLADLEAESRLLAIAGGERRLTNFQQIFEMLHEAEHEHHLSPEGLLQWLRHERTHQDEIDYQRRELRLESDDDAVQILTVHGSKGLQYEIVFCPFAWGGRGQPRVPLLVNDGPSRELVFSTDDHPTATALGDEERLAEDVRLVYVAVTRAKRRCYVHWGPIGSQQAGSWRSALAWLLQSAPPPRIRTDWLSSWAKTTKDDLPAFATALVGLVARSDGTMSIDVVPDAPEPVATTPATAAETRAPRVAVRKPYAFALHSFTSMVAGAPTAEPAPEVEDPASTSPAAARAAPAGIFAFRRGALAGQCLHSILEHVDLGALDGDAARDLVAATLRQSGLDDPAAHDGPIAPVDDVLANLRAVAAARVGAAGPSLGALCAGERIAEWPFALPVPRAQVHDLADALRRHGSAPARDYADRMEQLPQRTLRGFLTGFVDLVVRHDDRYWVLDWKSNHLGDARTDYGPATLATAMRDHDYVLQYHLYVLALHRHLAARLPDYRPEQHLGGACYVFLRGAEPGTDSGLFVDTIPPALLAAMDRWAGNGGAR